MSRTVEQESKKKLDTNDALVINQLITPKKSSTKWLLKKLMPYSQKAVARREGTKSLLIEIIHVFRLAYRKLAVLLVREGKLPDEGLIFFFTNPELKKLIDKPNASLVRKAMLRKKLFPKLQNYQFDENNVGMPKPRPVRLFNFIIKIIYINIVSQNT